MDKLELINFLENHHSKEDIKALTEKVEIDDINLNDVFDLTFLDKKKVAFRAAWLLENIATVYPLKIASIAKVFLRTYHLQKNLSARRHFSKIALIMLNPRLIDIYSLKYNDFDKCVEASFDWLLDEDTPLAIKCNCIEVLYNLSDHEDWILEELMPILESNLLSTSPAILSRTKAILEKYKKRRVNEFK